MLPSNLSESARDAAASRTNGRRWRVEFTRHLCALTEERALRPLTQSIPIKMPTTVNKKVLAVLDDLFFTVKINESAKRAGLPVEFVKSEQDVLEKAKTHPALIILDLNYAGVDPL